MEGINKPTSSQQVSEKEQNEQNQELTVCKKRGHEVDRNILILTKDIIFSILIRLPAEVLYDVVRYVCKQWYGMVHDPAFISAHHQLSSVGIITQTNYSDQRLAIYLESNPAGFNRKELRLPFSAKVLGSCQGLVLLHNRMNPKIIYVANLTTKVLVILPPLPQSKQFSERHTTLSCTSSSKYKVVHLDGNIKPEEVLVCTIGVDRSWRKIDVTDKYLGTFMGLVPPVSVPPYVYWYDGVNRFGYALDMDSETIHHFNSPESYEENQIVPACISIESRGLGLVISSFNECIWVIWELTDVKSGKWAKLLVIDMKSVKSKLPRFMFDIPVYFKPVSLQKGELWINVAVYPGRATLARYNIKRGIILLSSFDKLDGEPTSYVHVNTLISPKICCGGVIRYSVVVQEAV